MGRFKLNSSYKPSGDQPRAIQELVEGVRRGDKYQTLLGVTGSGKTFTISNLIEEVQMPTLVISPNKTLAAQLYGEFCGFFPDNAVEYFISFYDYYQPEAYMPTTDTYIEKDFAINDEIDRLRLKATSALVEDRKDVIVVASVSCIYSIGKKDDFLDQLFTVRTGAKLDRQKFLYKLSELYYSRNDVNFTRGTFRVRGDVVDILPGYERENGIRIEFFGSEVDKISMFDVLTGSIIEKLDIITIYPSKIFVTTEEQLNRGMQRIKDELIDRLKFYNEQGKYLEAQRLEQRTFFDLEMMKEVGYCSGIENYSMHLSGRDFGDRPTCIFDFFPPDNYLLIIDESHVTIPQIRGMYGGDRSRKTTLIEHGFRLPSAIENRPLNFGEVEKLINQAVFVSATPGDWELEQCGGVVVEQIIRPTGLLDPEISVRPIKHQIDDLLFEIRNRTEKQQRVLITTMTKRMAEDLTDYLTEHKVKCQYIHSDVDNFDRVEILRNLRLGKIDVIVGVNLLREGLDLPEVSLVAVLDADKEGFLRSEKSLLQVAGRTARNVEGLVIMYADRITKSMQFVIDETNRRRKLQQEYNEEHNIHPETVYKTIEEIMSTTSIADIGVARKNAREDKQLTKMAKRTSPVASFVPPDRINEYLEDLYKEMKQAAKDLDFERAASLRDEIALLKRKQEIK
ncbi:MAG: excinuclease ABC subunit UvrB [Ignavibacteria bacterium]|jgi:excinuclease ABC subunit B|nr:excinuclease ABC subunit UvrB [Ignavibacteria bacterium]